METLLPGVTKEQDSGMLNFIVKNKYRDDNFFEDMLNETKAKKTKKVQRTGLRLLEEGQPKVSEEKLEKTDNLEGKRPPEEKADEEHIEAIWRKVGFIIKKARVLGYIVTKEKGDAEPQKKEQDWGMIDSITNIESKDDNFFADMLNKTQKKEQDFGRIDFIAKIESRDDNFFEDVLNKT